MGKKKKEHTGHYLVVKGDLLALQAEMSSGGSHIDDEQAEDVQRRLRNIANTLGMDLSDPDVVQQIVAEANFENGDTKEYLNTDENITKMFSILFALMVLVAGLGGVFSLVLSSLVYGLAQSLLFLKYQSVRKTKTRKYVHRALAATITQARQVDDRIVAGLEYNTPVLPPLILLDDQRQPPQTLNPQQEVNTHNELTIEEPTGRLDLGGLRSGTNFRKSSSG